MAATHCSSLASEQDTYCSLNGSCDSVSDPPTVDAGPWWCEVHGIAAGEGSAVTTDMLPPSTLADGGTPTTVRYYLPVYDFTDAVNGVFTPVSGLAVVGCHNSDLGCSGTTVMATVHPPKDIRGYGIDLPYNFNGAIRITASGYIPVEYLFGGPLLGSPSGAVDPADGVPTVQGLSITPIAIAALTQIYTRGNFSPIAGTGLLAPRLLDCNGKRADQVRLSVMSPNAGAQPFTLINNVPLYNNPPLPTDARGVTGYANLAIGDYPISGLTPDGVAYGINTPAPIFENTMTILEVRTDNEGALGR